MSTDVLVEKLYAALEGELCALRIEARPVRAVEAVPGRVKMVDPARVSFAYFAHCGLRNMRVLLAEVKHHGNARNVRKLLVDPAAVIGDRGVDIHACRSQKRDLTAPAVAHDADLARRFHMVRG